MILHRQLDSLINLNKYVDKNLDEYVPELNIRLRNIKRFQREINNYFVLRYINENQSSEYFASVIDIKNWGLIVFVPRYIIFMIFSLGLKSPIYFKSKEGEIGEDVINLIANSNEFYLFLAEHTNIDFKDNQIILNDIVFKPLTSLIVQFKMFDSLAHKPKVRCTITKMASDKNISKKIDLIEKSKEIIKDNTPTSTLYSIIDRFSAMRITENKVYY